MYVFGKNFIMDYDENEKITPVIGSFQKRVKKRRK